MTASEFRAKWLDVFKDVAATGEPVLITKRGRPFLQLESIGAPATPQGFPCASERIPCIGVARPEARPS
jgi:prevent-host-death family protein